MKIAYLSSSSTLPDSRHRRDDAFEHDYQVAELAPPLEKKKIGLVPIDWRLKTHVWTDYAAVVIGTTWDYCDHSAEFLQTLDYIEACRIPLFNSAAMVRWNSRKAYLQELAAKGVSTIPTLWLSSPTADELERAFDQLGSDTLVVKRQIGAGAVDQIRIKRGDDISDYPYDAMVQPFLSTIQTEGEYSFIMIDGEFSHALIKRAKSGDYRIQSLYGGQEEKVLPNESDVKTACGILGHLPEMPLYARVDMVRGTDGALWLMELELIEPYLYPVQADRLGEMFANALFRRLKL